MKVLLLLFVGCCGTAGHEIEVLHLLGTIEGIGDSEMIDQVDYTQ